MLAVDPFTMSAWPFRALDGAFPLYTWWSEETIVLNAAWLVGLLVATALVVRRAASRPREPFLAIAVDERGAPRHSALGSGR